MDTNTNFYRHILLIVICGFATIGCVGVPVLPDGPAPVSLVVRQEFGRMAIRAPSKPPVTLTADLDTKGKAAGKTAAAAGAGWLGGTFDAASQAEDPFAGVLVLAFGIVTAPLVATGGAIYGASVADTDDAIKAGNKILEDALDFAPARFSHSLQAVMKAELPVPYAVVPNNMTNKNLSRLGFDSVMDVQIETLQSQPSTNGMEVNFSSHNRVIATALDDGRLLEERYYDQQTSDRSISHWARDNGEVLLEELDTGFIGMSQDIVDEFFAAPAIRVQGLEPVSNGGWGKAGRISGLMPMFVWTALDGANGTPGNNVTYEIMIFPKKNPPEAGVRSATMHYVPAAPLITCESYRWKIRAHYESFSVPTTSHWTPTYRFKTPCD